MAKAIKIIIFAKSIDGGTGTFFQAMRTLPDYFSKGELHMLPLVLEQPHYRKIKLDDITYFQTGQYPIHYKFSLQNVFTFLRELRWLKQQFSSHQPDVILSVDSHCNLLVLILTQIFFTKTKVIITTHNHLSATLTKKSSPFLNKILRSGISILYKKADAIVGVSNGVINDLKHYTGIKKNMHVIYYGIKRPKTGLTKNLHKKKKIIITLTRLVEQKDTKTLIQAFKLLQNHTDQTELMIVGDGPLKNDLKELVYELGIEKTVTFIGWENNTSHLLRKADIFILSSHREGLPYSILEALANNLPVISTNSPYGPQEILKNNTYGILTPMKDPIAMKNNILTLLTKPSVYQHYVQKSAERSAFFTEEKMLNAYKKIITKLLR